MELREAGERIGEAVRQLPHEQQAVFLLRVYDEMTYAEIAAVLGRPLGTVKTQMRNALIRLRADLREIGEMT